MRAIAWAVLPLASWLCASAAMTQERCLVQHYRLPASIAEEMRPYLVCGMLQGDGHHTVRLNGQGVSLRGGGLENCGRIRVSAFEASDSRLRSAMPDPTARRRFVEAEFETADRFLRVAARSGDLSVGEDPTAPRCRNSNAQN